MNTEKKVGIWMDHQRALLMEYTTAPMVTQKIMSDFTHVVKEASLHQGENKMHSKEQHQQASYYRALSAAILPYNNVLLFGPTDAKTELFNILLADPKFAKIKMEIKHADKMTENQQHAFVRKHFLKHNSSEKK
jgi:hypothetical protein